MEIPCGGKVAIIKHCINRMDRETMDKTSDAGLPGAKTKMRKKPGPPLSLTVFTSNWQLASQAGNSARTPSFLPRMISH